MERSILIAGFGGQGILLTGTILANAFMFADKSVMCCPCYGAQMRGGEVNCEVVYSDKNEICTNKCEMDIIIALNQLSFDKFITKLKQGGTIIANSSLINVLKPRNDINYVFAKITDLAIEIGDIKVANIISLGILGQIEKISTENLQNAIKKVFFSKKQNIINLNIAALKLGLRYAYQN